MASDIIGILLSSGIDKEASIKRIQDDLNDIAKQLKLNLTADSSSLKKVAKDFQTVGNDLNKSFNSANTNIDKVTNKITTLADGTKTTEQNISEFTTGLGKSKKIINDLDVATGDIAKTTEIVSENYKVQRKEQEKLLEAMAKGREKSEQRVVSANRKSEIEQAKATNKALEEEYENKIRLDEKRKETIELLKREKIAAQSLTDQSLKFGDKSQHEALKRYNTEIQNMSVKTNASEKELRELNSQLKLAKANLSATSKQARALGNNSMTMGQMFSTALEKFTIWMGASTIFFQTIRSIRTMIEEVYELNTAITELNKVLDVNESRLLRYTQSTFKYAEQIGRTARDFINASAEFGRAGFGLDDTKTLSQNALLLTNVADGLENTADAAGYLISAMKAYNLTVEDSSKIVDIWNQVSNTSAINTVDLAEIFSRASATMAQAGNSLEEFTGLATGAFEILRDSSRVATGLRTLSLRIQGIAEDGEAIDGLSAKLHNLFMKYTDGAVSIEDINGQLRSTFDILKDLAKLYQGGFFDNNQKALGLLIEEAAGKRQADLVYSILRNWEGVEKAVLNATESSGSAMRENEKILDSIYGRINLFKNAVQELSYNTISSDFVGSIVDAGTAIIKFIDNVGLLNTTIIAATLAFTLFNKTLLFGVIEKMAVSIAVLATNMGVAAGYATALGVALSLITPVLIVGGIIALVKALDSLNTSITKYNEKVQEADEKATDNISKINNQIKRYEELSKKVKLSREEKLELIKIERDLKLKYGETTRELDLQNGAIEKNIELMKRATEEEARRFQIVSQKAYEEAQKTLNSKIYMPGELNIVGLENYIEYFERYVQTLADSETGILQRLYEVEVEVLKNLYNEYDAAIEITNKWEHYENILNGTLEENSNVVDDNSKSAEQYAKTIDELNDEFEKFNETTDNTFDSLSSLSNAYNTLSNGEKISLENVIELVKQYPKLANYINETNDLTFDRGNIVKQVWEIEKAIELQRLETQEKQLENEYALQKALLKRTDITALYSGQITPEMEKIREQLKLNKTLQNLYSDAGIYEFSSKSTTSTKTPYQATIDSLTIYQQKLDEINTLLERNNILADQAEGVDKITLLKQRIELLEQQKQALHDINNANDELVQSSLDSLNKLYGNIGSFDPNTNELIWKNGESGLYKWQEILSNLVDDEAKDLEKVIKDISDRVNDNIKGSTEWLNITKDIDNIQKDISKTLNEQYEKQIKIASDAHKEITKILEEAVGDRKKLINEEFNAFKDSINQMIQEMDRLYDSEDYESQIQKQHATITDIIKERNALLAAAASGDLQAQSKLNDLTKKEAEEREKLSDMQTKRERDLRKQNLQDTIANAEKSKDVELDKLDEIYNAEVLLYKSGEMLYQTTLDNFSKMLQSFLSNLGTAQDKIFEIMDAASISYQTSQKGSSILKSQGVAPNKIQNVASLSDMHPLLATMMVVDPNNARQDFDQYVANKKKAEDLYTALNNWNHPEILKYRDINDLIRKKYNIASDIYSYNQLKGYALGGINTIPGLYALHGTTSRPEIILNYDQIKDVLSGNFSKTPLANIKIPQTNIPNISNKPILNIGNLLSINGNVDEKIVPRLENMTNQIANIVIDKMKIVLNKSGQFRTV